MKPEIGIGDKERAGVVDILNVLLADEAVLYTKTRNYHWNVKGMHFNDLHKFLDAQYGELNEMVDDVAERARALGGTAIGSMAEFLKRARLKERAGIQPDAPGMLRTLLEDHETVIRYLRADLKIALEKYIDAGTSDFLTGLLEQHEKMAWMLRSTLEK
jgi:starvation-inducible DNA-binding protein